MAAVCTARIIHPRAVAAGRSKVPEAPVLERMGGFFKVLGDPTRLKVLYALQAGELCVCDLAEVLDMTVSAVSHQLAVLRGVRLVRPRRDGKVVFYALSDGHVRGLLRSLRDHLAE